jgi:hypothetical protein
MKQILKTLGMAAACVAGLFLFTAAALNAWDAEGTAKLKRDFEYRKEYAPETITSEYIERYNSMMPDDEKIELGHCNFETDEYQKSQAVFNIAMMLYIESGENVDFDDCLKAAESYMED